MIAKTATKAEPTKETRTSPHTNVPRKKDTEATASTQKESKADSEEKSPRKFRCYICNATFPSREEFKVHARTAEHSTSRAVVLNLPPTTSNEEFFEIVQKHEPKMTQAWVRKRTKRVHRGEWVGSTTWKKGNFVQMTIGYVIFPDDTTRDKFVDTFDGMEIGGYAVSVESIIKGPTIVLTGISEETTEETTRKHFAKFNPINTAIKLFHGKRSARVTFSSHEDRDAALKCDNTLDGCKVNIKPWKSRFELNDGDKKRRGWDESADESDDEDSPHIIPQPKPVSNSTSSQPKTPIKETKPDTQKLKKWGREDLFAATAAAAAAAAAAASASAATPSASTATPSKTNVQVADQPKKAEKKSSVIVTEEKPKSYPVEVTNLPDEVDENNIEQIFEGYVIVEKVLDMANNMATVHFETEEIAMEIADIVDEALVNGKTIKARYIKPRKRFSAKRVAIIPEGEEEEEKEKDKDKDKDKEKDKEKEKDKDKDKDKDKEKEKDKDKDKDKEKEELIKKKDNNNNNNSINNNNNSVNDVDDDDDDDDEKEEEKIVKDDAKKKEPQTKKIGKSNFKAHVKNLDFSINSAQLKGIFLAYNCTYAYVSMEKGRSLGFGMVKFPSKEDMDAAIEAMNGRAISGRPINIEAFDPSKNKKDSVVDDEGYSYKLHISFLPRTTTKEDIEEFLSKFKPVTVDDRSLKKSKYAVVEFANEKDMDEAYKYMESKLFNIFKLKVKKI